jgi:hypothetical protein
LYFSPNIIRAIKAKRIRWTGHVARMGEMRSVYKILVGKLKGERPHGRLGVHERIILEWILGK